MAEMDIMQYEKDQLDKAVKWMDENWEKVPHAVQSTFNDGATWKKEHIARMEKREKGAKQID